MHCVEICNYGQGGIQIRKPCIIIIVPSFTNCKMHPTLKRIQVFKKEVGRMEFYKCILCGIGSPIFGIILAIGPNEM
jgi:hypothetical protein